MAIPIPNSRLAARVFSEVAPAMRGWPEENVIMYLRYIEAWALPLVELDNVVRDDLETGIMGWGKILHPDTAPDAWLDWLAQLTGTKMVAGETAPQKRARIKGMEGLRRGSIQAATSAIQATQTDSEAPITIHERYQGSAWRTKVVTYRTYTPDLNAVKAAVKSQKPAGIVAFVELHPGWSIGDMVKYYEARGDNLGEMTQDPDNANIGDLVKRDPI